MSADSNASEVDANQSKSSRPVFDEETYEKAKPLFIAGVQHFKKAGMSFADALSALLDWLKESCEFTVQEIKDMKPYVLRFMKDWRAGRIHLDAEANVKGQGDINSSEPSTPSLTPFQTRLRNNFLKRLDEQRAAQVMNQPQHEPAHIGKTVSYPADSHWMPTATSDPPTYNRARQRVGVVKGKEGQALDLEDYRSLLADRLICLLEREEDSEQALSDLMKQLYDEELYPNMDPEREYSTTEIVDAIFQDGSLRQHLSQMDVPGRLPPTFPPNDPKAEELYRSMSIENWTNSLLETEPSFDG